MMLQASKSDVFREMVEGNETKEVHVEGVGGESVKVFVKYFYSAKVSKEEMHAHSIELVKLAHFYRVKELIKRLDKYISQANIIGRNSLIEIVKLAYLHGLKKTKKMIQRFIVGGDGNNELFSRTLKQLYAVNTGVAHEFSRDITSLIQARND